ISTAAVLGRPGAGRVLFTIPGRATMRRKIRVALLLSFIACVTSPSWTEGPPLWRIEAPAATAARADALVRPMAFALYRLDDAALGTLLFLAPRESAALDRREAPVLEIPLPDGTLARFRFVQAPVMAPELAAKFPEIQTYMGQGIDDAVATV